MRFLLDTSVLLWAMSDDPRLTDAVRNRIVAATVVRVSAVSIWEISIKVALGRLRIDVDALVERLPQAGFVELPVTWDHGRAVRALPHHHRDPFDRMLVAQALSEPLRLLTSDRLLTRYGDHVEVV